MSEGLLTVRQARIGLGCRRSNVVAESLGELKFGGSKAPDEYVMTLQPGIQIGRDARALSIAN